VQSQSYDAIVVGSGISGGWAAKELTEKGLRVLLLERGKNIEHIKDYPNATKAPWDYPHRGRRTKAMEAAYPVLKRDYPLNEMNLDWWASDQESPYTEVKRFDWYRGYHVGGRSLMWGRQSYRWSDFDFEANAREGVGVDWPIRYADIAPWYDHVERHAGISGSLEGMPQLPDGQFQPAMPLNCGEELIAGRLKQQFDGRRRIIPGRTANLTQALPGRAPCQFRNACWLGCPFGGYFSTQSSTLPAAMATGRLTLKPFAIVTEVLYDRNKKRATGVRVLDAVTDQVTDYNARIIFLCASTLNSTWLLLRSATNVWPGGLGSSSHALGRNLMDHNYRGRVYANHDGFQDQYYYGRRPTGVYIPRFRNFGNDKQQNFIRGYAYACGASRSTGEIAHNEIQIGSDLKENLSEPGPWSWWMVGMGECLPYTDNRVTLSKEKKDEWGMPILQVNAEFRTNEDVMLKDILTQGAEMLEKAGFKDINPFQVPHAVMGHGIHEMGTARMGRDPKTSILNGFNQMHAVKNVFVTDGACMTSGGCQNPSITYMALTARAVDYLVGELKKQNV